MKVSTEKNIAIGFIINLLIVGILIAFNVMRIFSEEGSGFHKMINWVDITLNVILVALLIIVYYIMRAQTKEKNLSQKLLSENKQLLQSVLDNTTSAISVKKISGEYLLTNKRFEQLFQISLDELRNKTDYDFLPKEMADTLRESDFNVIKAGKELKVEETIKEADGIHTYLSIKFPILDTENRIYAVGAISTDISERKVLEDSFKEGDKFFNMSLDILVIANTDTFIKVNPTLSKILGYPDKDLLNRTFFSFVLPEDINMMEKEIFKLQKGYNSVNFANRWVCKDGTIKWLSWIITTDFNTGLLYAIARDISEQIKNEESLKTANSFFENSFDAFAVSVNEKIIKINPGYTKILGYNQSDLENLTFKDLLHPDYAKNALDTLQKNLQGASKPEPMQLPLRCKDGTYKWMEITTTIDLTTGLINSVLRDISDRVKNEESLKMANNFFELSFDPLFVAHGNKIIKINPAFTKILGYNQKDLDLITYPEILHTGDRAIAVEQVTKLLKGEPSSSFRYRVLCKDGSQKLIDVAMAVNTQTRMIYSVGRDVSDKIKNEESVKIANSFFDLSFDAFFVALGNKIIKINPAFTKTIGFDQNELDSIPFLDLIHPDYAELAKISLDKLLKGETQLNSVFPIKTNNGTYKWIEMVATTDMQSGMIYFVSRDITQKKIDQEKLEIFIQKLKENEQQIQSIFDGAPDPVIIIDSESKILRWNPKAEKVFGWPLAEVLGKPIFEFIIPQRYREAHKSGMDKFLKTGIGPVLNKAVELEAIRKNGEEFPVSLSISPLNFGEKFLFIGFVRDITESKEIVNELYENEEKLKLILENIGDGVIVANKDKKILMANYKANELFGVEADEDISFNLSDHFKLYLPDEKTVFPAQGLPMERALMGETTEDVDVVLYDEINHTKKRVLISGRPLIDPENKVVAAVVTIKDISKYKQMEEDLKETELKYRRIIGFQKGPSE